MDFLRQTPLLLLPLVLLQLGLMIAAMVDLTRRERVAGGKKWVWALVILFVGIIGPVFYFAVGRKE